MDIHIYICIDIYTLHMLQELQVPQILGTLSASRAIADSVLARLAIGASVKRSWRPFLFTWFLDGSGLGRWAIPVERNCGTKM